MTDRRTSTPDTSARHARATASEDGPTRVERLLEDCPECDGQGYHDIRQFGRHVEDEWISKPCRWCDGTGTVLTERLVAS